ncbi:hypothetical protein OBBRIDRAFT_579611 [Obba rivulosa]|uniref:Uncharacterized protein n=1 Tax=Obba rivulosa TaxID=1052685 RepID=A0A8E2DTQ8_9APHY|nr:hypothetical protein OBBRIDRAFT_579611 [Obba rivulosa]
MIVVVTLSLGCSIEVVARRARKFKQKKCTPGARVALARSAQALIGLLPSCGLLGQAASKLVNYRTSSPIPRARKIITSTSG